MSGIQHKELFDADPAKYEPQFGGFCAYAVSQNRAALRSSGGPPLPQPWIPPAPVTTTPVQPAPAPAQKEVTVIRGTEKTRVLVSPPKYRGVTVVARVIARPRLDNGQLSDLRRSVAATVKFLPTGYEAPYQILRWYDNAWRN